MRVLLVEANDDDAILLQALFGDLDELVLVTHVNTLNKALQELSEDHDHDVVLLSLDLPDSNEIRTLVAVHSHSPNIPVIVLTEVEDQQLGIRAIQAGAQEYLVKGRMPAESLIRCVHYAIARNRQQNSMFDELTELGNKRGFLVLSGQQMKVSQRLKRMCAIVSLDIVDLHHINAEHGYRKGDEAIRQVANILRDTTRASDLVGRITGDEFAIFIGDAKKETPRIVERINENLTEWNNSDEAEYTLALTSGIAFTEPDVEIGSEELLMQARNDRESEE